MGASGALQWLEEWQLRILVLGSLVVQYILLVASVVRKFPIRSWRRPIIWLAYLASDAIAIYALATLFSRRSKPQQEDGDGSSSLLEVLWAPILLIHLGGQDGITAYNIEDNELWTRHILTSVSQVTVAIYVFWKSWPGNDTRLLVAAILLFIFGILKCLEKPWALNRASINSLVSSGEPVRRSINAQKLRIDPLEDFIGKVNSPAEVNTPATPVDFTPYKLFVDLASPSPGDRIGMLRSFSALNDYQAYSKLQYWLSETFQLFYTKEKIFPNLLRQMLSLIEWAGASARARALGYANIREMESSTSVPPFDQGIPISFGFILRGLVGYLLFPTIALFHYSRREAYSEDDVKVTYALLCCTVALQVFAMALKDVTRVIGNPDPQAVRTENGGMLSQYIHLRERHDMRRTKPLYDDMISQYNLIGLLVRNREHSKMMWVVGVLGCDDFLQQRWRMKSCSSSFSITKLVLKYLKDGWEHHIRDVSSYRKFNDNRGQFTLGREGCSEELGWSLEGAFDESVLLWHLATDFCYYGMGASRSYHGYRCMKDSRPHVYACPAWCQGSDHHEGAVQCREMSNYMMYLLFVNPEMLMAGTRRNLFTAAYAELQGTIVEGGESPLAERELTQRIMALGGEGSPDDDSQQEGIIRDARAIARVLSGLPEDKMWAMIEGVWVEMLCFSAARCRGYLHAKGLATGVEYLTYVWLLQYYMGMETLAAKLQRADHRRSGGEREDNPSSYGASRSAFARGQAAGPSRSSGGATEEEHARGQSASYHASYGTLGELV